MGSLVPLFAGVHQLHLCKAPPRSLKQDRSHIARTHLIGDQANCCCGAQGSSHLHQGLARRHLPCDRVHVHAIAHQDPVHSSFAQLLGCGEALCRVPLQLYGLCCPSGIASAPAEQDVRFGSLLEAGLQAPTSSSWPRRRVAPDEQQHAGKDDNPARCWRVELRNDVAFL